MGKQISILDKVYIAILLVIFGGIVLHAPISVGLSALFPGQELLIKSWKEVLLGVALLLSVVILTTKKQWGIVTTKLIYCIALFAGLNLLLIPAYYNGFEATIAGLFINLRYFLFFVLVYIALKLFPQYYRLFLTVFLGGALIVTVFAMLQVTVLPHDVLKYLGYNESSIVPYLTVDQNMNYIRINSTLRGPNPLGIYAVITLCVALAAWLFAPRKLTKKEQVLAAIIAAGSLVALLASYSRSAALAAIAAVGIILVVIYGRRISRKIWIAVAIGALVLTGGFIALRDTQFVSQVILHEDPSEGNDVNSNEGHAESLAEGTRRMLQEPLGRGIGSTGSASLHSDEPLIVENQYLFVAHETGWLGLTLFLVINYLVLKGLWLRRKQWLSLAVFASGIGIAIAGLFLPVWADDTVSIIWWGLAAICLALPVIQSKQKPRKKSKIS